MGSTYACRLCKTTFEVVTTAITLQVKHCPFCGCAVASVPPPSPDERKKDVEEAVRKGFNDTGYPTKEDA